MPRRRTTYVRPSLLERLRNGPPPHPALVLVNLTLTSLVLAGISTSGVVLSTLRQAADLDFGLSVLRDACADADEEVHRVLCEKVFPRQAEVLDTDACIASL